MATLALAGITGMYLRQVTKIGLLGLFGYVVFAAGYLSMLGAEYVATPTGVALVSLGYSYGARAASLPLVGDSAMTKGFTAFLAVRRGAASRADARRSVSRGRETAGSSTSAVTQDVLVCDTVLTQSGNPTYARTPTRTKSH